MRLDRKPVKWWIFRPRQLRLWSLFVFLSIACVLSAHIGSRLRLELLHDEAVKQLRKAGLEVRYLSADQDYVPALPVQVCVNWFKDSGTPVITDTGLLALAHHFKFINVIDLCIHGGGISDRAIVDLAPNLNSLQMLTLDHVPVSDEAIPAIATLRTLTSIHTTGTDITDEGVEKLREALPDCSVFRHTDDEKRDRSVFRSDD